MTKKIAALLALSLLACGPAPTYITNDITVMGDSGPAAFPDSGSETSVDSGSVENDAGTDPETSLNDAGTDVQAEDSGDPGDAMAAPETAPTDASPDAPAALCCTLYSTPPMSYPCPVKGEGFPDAGNYVLSCLPVVGASCQMVYDGEIMGWNVTVCP